MSDELPNSPDSERAILGSILLDNLLCGQARREMKTEWFYSFPYKQTFLAILVLHERKEEIDVITLADELRRSGELEKFGGVGFISKLSFGLPHVSNLKTYIVKVKETARRRWLIKFADRLGQQARDESEKEELIFSQAIEQLDRVRNIKSEARKPKILEDLGDDQLLRYDLYFRGVSDALPTGFEKMDSHLLGGGFVPSGLYVLAAATSIGKTSLALDISMNIAERGRRVYIVSREMSRESIFDRLVAVEADVARWKLRPGIYEAEYKLARSAVLSLAMRPVIIDDVSVTVSDIHGYLREYERRGDKVDLLVVDYLQLLEGSRRENRTQEVGSVSRALKGLAMEFQMSVLSLSQLNRNAARDKREPELHDLRESGDIEQDADAVFFLFGEKPEEGAKFYDRTLKCAKHREGPLFTMQMPFNGELVTYRRPRIQTQGETYEQSN